VSRSRALVVSDATVLAVAYDKARTALAELKAIPLDELTLDQARAVDDAAELIQVTARQARDRQMEVDAVEIRMRAERRLGGLLAERKAGGGLNAGTRGQLRGRGSHWRFVAGTAKAEARGARDRQETVGLGAAARRDPGGGVRKQDHDLARPPREGDRAGEPRDHARRGQGRSPGDPRGRAREEDHGAADAQVRRDPADPEWRFEPRSRATGLDRSADNHYPTSSTDEIAMRAGRRDRGRRLRAVPMGDAPMLPDALRVMAAWGFAYKSQVIWRKAERRRRRSS
jgi:hypothetical protein